MATRGSYSGSSKSPRHPKLGRLLQITKGSKRYRIDLGCSDWAREAYEWWQKNLEHCGDTNVRLVQRALDLLEDKNKVSSR